jgi:DNA polymerase-3 subunit beta
MKVTSSDLQTSLNVSFEIKNLAQTNFSACMPLESLKFLKKVSGEISLSHDSENYSIIFEESDGRAKYSGENAIDFPVIERPGMHLYNLPKGTEKEFKDMLNYVSNDELRPAMTGISFGSRGKQFFLVATDGHTLKRLNIPELNGSDKETDFILPAKAAKILSDSKVNSEINVYENRDKDSFDNESHTVSFWFESPIGFVELVTKSIDERYPDYNSVIPEKSLTQYTFDSKLFLKQLDKVELFANKTTHQVRLSLNGINKLSAEDIDFSNEACYETKGSYTGKEIEIGFNAEFLKKTVKSFGDSVTLEMIAPNKCAVIKDAKALVLVMPVMLMKYEDK